MNRLLLIFILFNTGLLQISAQTKQEYNSAKKKWIDTEFNKMTSEQKIAQLMIIRFQSNWDSLKTDSVSKIAIKYNVGGLCFFQGTSVKQALITNFLQKKIQTPLIISIDAEWGLGMRLTDIIPLSKNIQLGALTNDNLIFQQGVLMGNQCKRLGIQINYAPVADINMNPDNPVINDRSFGEDKKLVAQKSLKLMKGLQSTGVIACAKHYPGHGDVNQDSHFELPLIKKSEQEITNNELTPFQLLIDSGIKMVMIGHLFIPSLDTTHNQPSSLSSKIIQNKLKIQQKFNGLVITDALEMQAIQKYFPQNQSLVEALKAGNDLLCLPASVPEGIAKIKLAIDSGILSWEHIDNSVKKILAAKFEAGLNLWKPIDTNNLTADLNKGIPELNTLIARESITVLSDHTTNIPFKPKKKYGYLKIGGSTNTDTLWQLLSKMPQFNTIYIPFDQDSLSLDSLKNSILTNNINFIGLQSYNRRPANYFSIPTKIIHFINSLSNDHNVLLCFGNPYALNLFQESFKDRVVLYEDNVFTELAAFQWLIGNIAAKGILPVSIKYKGFN